MTGQRVVVIGAGIVVVGAAIWLARDGRQVTVLDPNGPAGGTSYGNAGILAASSIVPVTVPGLLGKAPKLLFGRSGPLFLKWRYLPRLLPWLVRYLRHCNLADVDRIAAALTPSIGDSLEQHLALARGTPAERFIQPVSYTYAYAARAAYESDGLAWRVRAAHGFVAEELEEPRLRALEPSLGPEVRFGAQVRGHAWVRDPGAYVKALARYAESLGVTFEVAAAEGFERDASTVVGVRTSAGVIPCDHAVLTAGVWSAQLLEPLGFRVPLESERGYHLELVDAEGGPSIPMALAAYKFIATPMEGRLRLAGIVEFGGLDAPASEAPYRLLRQQAQAAFPDLKWTSEKRWLGLRPATPDSIPVIGAVPGLQGLHIGFGHQHVGLTGGPKTGRLIADLIAGRAPNFDLRPYAIERFGR